jgi:F-type H+-transporting ATPase subunit b
VINLDKTLILQMINFLIILWILNRFVFKPILGILEKRRERIQQSGQTVQALESRAAQQWESYQRQLQEAKIEANLEKERIKGEGLEAQRKLLEAARTESHSMLEETRKRIGKEVTKARELLIRQAEQIAVEMAEKILGRRLQ